MKKIKILLPIIILVMAAYIIFIIVAGRKKDDDKLTIKRGSNETESISTDSDASDDEGTLADGDKEEADSNNEAFSAENVSTAGIVINGEEVPEYVDEPYAQINYNEPFFEKSELKTESYESFSEFDELGRCKKAEACVGIDIIPQEERGDIPSDIKPTGWHIVKYEGTIEGDYLYNRCHLLDYQLTGNNTEAKNFITGTEYFNVEGMLPFENMIARYVEKTGNHVMYRVTPYYKGDNLLATGVLLEAYSVEDDGMGVFFNAFIYNVQPGIEIDYSNGESRLK